jgi:hypothetical protein
MARTVKRVAPSEEDLQAAFRDGRRGRDHSFTDPALISEWKRGYAKWKEVMKETPSVQNIPRETGAVLEQPPCKKSRRTVAPGEPPKCYNQGEWPRGGHVRINNEQEEAFCYARKFRFQEGGALWTDSSFCVYCSDKPSCQAWKTYRKHLRESYGI